MITHTPIHRYVGKFIANLTLAQVKTLDCGSLRQSDYRKHSALANLFSTHPITLTILSIALQILYPYTRISTLPEFFSFLTCADPSTFVKLNIESKVDAATPNATVSVSEFVRRQYGDFSTFGRSYFDLEGGITYQSFDWRTLMEMKKVDVGHKLLLSALVDEVTATESSPWLANLSLSSFPSPSLSQRIAQAAHSIGADILSPDATTEASTTSDPTLPGFEEFTTREMVEQAHGLGMKVKPWTVDNLNLVRRLVLEYGVDGIITDTPYDVRRWAKYEAGLPVARPFTKSKILDCLAKHNQLDSTSYLTS